MSVNNTVASTRSGSGSSQPPESHTSLAGTARSRPSPGRGRRRPASNARQEARAASHRESARPCTWQRRSDTRHSRRRGRGASAPGSPAARAGRRCLGPPHGAFRSRPGMSRAGSSRRAAEPLRRRTWRTREPPRGPLRETGRFLGRPRAGPGPAPRSCPTDSRRPTASGRSWQTRRAPVSAWGRSRRRAGSSARPSPPRSSPRAPSRPHPSRHVRRPSAPRASERPRPCPTFPCPACRRRSAGRRRRGATESSRMAALSRRARRAIRTTG